MADTAEAAAPTTGAEGSGKTAAVSTLNQTGDVDQILKSSDAEFGKAFGIEAILQGADFVPDAEGGDGKPAAADAAAIDRLNDEYRRDHEGELLPAYREDEHGNLHDKDGKFVSKEAAAAASAKVEGDPAASAEAKTEGDDVEKVDGEADKDKTDTAAEPAKLATDFVLKDAAGEEIEYPADLKIAFKADGKDVELPLDKTIRLAKMGLYNEEKEQRYAQIEERNGALEPYARDLFTENQQMEQYVTRLLSDEEFFVTAKELFAKENTPEAENERLRARIAAIEGKPEQERASAHITQAAASVAPVIEGLIAATKDVVQEAEVWSNLARLTAPYRNKAGEIPADRLGDVAAIVKGALTLTIESLADTRRLAVKQKTETDAELKKSKGKVLELKRRVTRAAAPTGQRANVTTQTSQRPTKANPRAEDTIDDALENAVRQSVG
jgi:hypothetical protein